MAIRTWSRAGIHPMSSMGASSSFFVKDDVWAALEYPARLERYTLSGRQGARDEQSRLRLVAGDLVMSQLHDGPVQLHRVEGDTWTLLPFDAEGSLLGFDGITAAFRLGDEISLRTCESWEHEAARLPALGVRSVSIEGSVLAFADGLHEVRVYEASGGRWTAVAVAGLPPVSQPQVLLRRGLVIVGAPAIDGVGAGAVFVLARGDGGYGVQQTIVGPANTPRFGRYIEASADTLMVKVDPHAFLYRIPGPGQGRHALVLETKLTHPSRGQWHNAALADDALAVPSAGALVVFRAADGRPTVSTRQASPPARTLPPTVGSVEGRLERALALLDAEPSEAAFRCLITEIDEAWTLDARTVEDEWLPAIEAGLVGWSAAMRTTSRVNAYSFPAPPGWYRLVRRADFSRHGDRETIQPESLVAIGACPLPAHLELLALDGCGLRGTHLKEIFAGHYLESLQALNLDNNRIGDAGMQILGKARLPLLRSLSVANYTGISAAGLLALATSTTLELTSLNVAYCTAARQKRGVVGGLRPTLDRWALRSLSLRGLKIGDAGLAELLGGRNVGALRSLDLCNNGLSSTALGHIMSAAPELSSLDLSVNNANPLWTEAVRSERLEVLSVDGELSATVRGQIQARFPNLRELRVAGSPMAEWRS